MTHSALMARGVMDPLFGLWASGESPHMLLCHAMGIQTYMCCEDG